MKIAIPTAGGKLCMHFGHSEKFLFIEVDVENKKIINKTELEPPPHEPGKLPKWVKENGADLVIAGGMGMRAQQLFQSHGINVLTGAQDVDPDKLVMDYLNNKLNLGQNTCDH